MDENGNDEISPSEIFSPQFRDGTGALDELLPAIQEAMHIGAGGEKFENIPGVAIGSLFEATSTSVPAKIDMQITDGTSNTIFQSQRQSPHIGLFALADGSVRFLKGTKGKWPKQLQYSDSTFTANLEPFTGSSAFSGPFRYVDQDGNNIIGVLIALEQPGSFGETSFGGVVITEHTTGVLKGAAGAGTVDITFKNGLQGAFDMQLQTKPFTANGRARQKLR